MLVLQFWTKFLKLTIAPITNNQIKKKEGLTNLPPSFESSREGNNFQIHKNQTLLNEPHRVLSFFSMKPKNVLNLLFLFLFAGMGGWTPVLGSCTIQWPGNNTFTLRENLASGHCVVQQVSSIKVYLLRHLYLSLLLFSSVISASDWSNF